MEPNQTANDSASWSALNLTCLALAYFCADLVLLKLAIGAGWTIIWPLNGITIALMLPRPRRQWPLLLFAIEFGTFLGEGLDTPEWSLRLLDRVWSLGEVMLSAYMLPRFESFEDWLAQPKIVVRIIAAMILGPALSGIFYGMQQHYLAHEPLFGAWNTWATPDILGIAVTLPLTLSLLSLETRSLFSRAHLRNTLLTICSGLAVAVLIFSEASYPLLFLLYPMLLFVDSRLHFAGASIAVFLSSIIGVYCTVNGYGPFGHWSPSLHISSDTALQIYLGFHVVALLPLSLVLMERKNITAQLKRANQQLLALAFHDALTGITNRRGFEEAVHRAWRVAIEQSTPLALLLIDVDHFKQYNDQYGHPAGDRCLIRIADMLNRIAGGGENSVARFGGEEFIVLLPGCAAGASFTMAETLRKSIIQEAIPHDANSSWGMVTVSIGCASTVPHAEENPDDLIARADQALYRAKQNGRNCWATMDFRANESQQLRQYSRLATSTA